MTSYNSKDGRAHTEIRLSAESVVKLLKGESVCISLAQSETTIILSSITDSLIKVGHLFEKPSLDVFDILKRIHQFNSETAGVILGGAIGRLQKLGLSDEQIEAVVHIVLLKKDELFELFDEISEFVEQRDSKITIS